MIKPKNSHSAPAADLKVLVLTPIKNAAAHVTTYFTLLSSLEANGVQLSLGLLESDSSDGTYDAFASALSSQAEHFIRTTLLRHDYGFHIVGPRSEMTIQRSRREVLARSRNRLLMGALRDEDWVLWLDADLLDYPPSLLTELLAARKDIVVPYCVKTDGRAFDLNTFCFSSESGGHDDEAHRHDGLFQPPRGVGRQYLDAFQDQDVVPVDSVGGTALLVRADLHREGLNFPPYSYKGYIETEGLAMMARDMGAQCYGLPRLRIVHANT